MSFKNDYMNFSSAPPKAPAEGMMYYDTDSRTVKVFDGSIWLTITDELIMTADMLWSAVLRVEAEHEEELQEELRKKESALALVV